MPPEDVLHEAFRQSCPDCIVSVEIFTDENDAWCTSVEHDPSCPWFRRHEREKAMKLMENLAFIDIETTGLLPGQHDPWEVGLITPDGKEHRWFLPANVALADPVALSIGGYHVRHPNGNAYEAPNEAPKMSDRGLVQWPQLAEELSKLTHGLHLVGNVVSFDADFASRLIKANGRAPSWHYHLIDVEAAAAGFLAARGEPLELPWDSEEISRRLNVSVEKFDRHTALGDCRWARAVYFAVFG